MEAILNATSKRGRHPLGGSSISVSPPLLKRARLEDEPQSPICSPVATAPSPHAPDQGMETPLAVALSQSMDSVNTATGEEEVSSPSL